MLLNAQLRTCSRELKRLKFGCEVASYEFKTNLRCPELPLQNYFIQCTKNYLISRPILSSKIETTKVRDQDQCERAVTKTETTKNRSRDLQPC